MDATFQLIRRYSARGRLLDIGTISTSSWGMADGAAAGRELPFNDMYLSTNRMMCLFSRLGCSRSISGSSQEESYRLLPPPILS